MSDSLAAIGDESPTSPDALLLIKGLYATLKVLYDLDEEGEDIASEYGSTGSVFVIARIDGAAVGCGGISPAGDHTANIKHVFVNEALRRHGIARAIMEALHSRAQAIGYRCLRLETGAKQTAAIGLYEVLGYSQIVCGSSPAWVLCFEKSLNQDMKL